MEITITLNDDQMDTLRSGRRLDIQPVLMDLVMPEFESADPIGVCQSCYGEYDKDELTEDDGTCGYEGFMLCDNCR